MKKKPGWKVWRGWKKKLIGVLPRRDQHCRHIGRRFPAVVGTLTINKPPHGDSKRSRRAWRRKRHKRAAEYCERWLIWQKLRVTCVGLTQIFTKILLISVPLCQRSRVERTTASPEGTTSHRRKSHGIIKSCRLEIIFFFFLKKHPHKKQVYNCKYLICARLIYV